MHKHSILLKLPLIVWLLALPSLAVAAGLKLPIVQPRQQEAPPDPPPPPSYLVMPDQASALARSQQQCQALGCDGVKTRYWWGVQPLSDGTAALVIDQAGASAATTTSAKAPQPTGLSAAEQSFLQSAAAIAPLLPVVAPAP